MDAREPIPEKYKCPITHKVMFKPVDLQCCHNTVDMSTIETIRFNNFSTKSSNKVTCPFCRNDDAKYTHNRALEKEINDFLDTHNSTGTKSSKKP